MRIPYTFFACPWSNNPQSKWKKPTNYDNHVCFISPLQWHGEIFLAWQRRMIRPLLQCPWVAFTDRRHKYLCRGAAGPNAGRALWRCPASAGLNQGRVSSSSLGLCGSERPGSAALHGTRTSLGCIRTHSSEGPTHVIWTQTEFFPGNHTVRPVARNCDPASSCLSLFVSADRSGLGPYGLQKRRRNLSPAVPEFPETRLVLLKHPAKTTKVGLTIYQANADFSWRVLRLIFSDLFTFLRSQCSRPGCWMCKNVKRTF